MTLCDLDLRQGINYIFQGRVTIHHQCSEKIAILRFYPHTHSMRCRLGQYSLIMLYMQVNNNKLAHTHKQKKRKKSIIDLHTAVCKMLSTRYVRHLSKCSKDSFFSHENPLSYVIRIANDIYWPSPNTYNICWLKYITMVHLSQ